MEPGGNLVYFSARQKAEGKQLILWHSLCMPGQPLSSLVPTACVRWRDCFSGTRHRCPGPQLPSQPRGSALRFGFVLSKPQTCCPAASRAHFGFNLHGAMEETQHPIAMGAFPALALALGAYGQVQPPLSSQKQSS